MQRRNERNVKNGWAVDPGTFWRKATVQLDGWPQNCVTVADRGRPYGWLDGWPWNLLTVADRGQPYGWTVGRATVADRGRPYGWTVGRLTVKPCDRGWPWATVRLNGWPWNRLTVEPWRGGNRRSRGWPWDGRISRLPAYSNIQAKSSKPGRSYGTSFVAALVPGDSQSSRLWTSRQADRVDVVRFVAVVGNRDLWALLWS